MTSRCLLISLVLLLAPLSPAQDPWVVYEGGDGPGKGKHVVLVAGDEEYRSEEALPMLAKILAVRHGFRCTVLFSIDPKTGLIDPMNQTSIPGLHHLKDADMAVLFLRFRELPDADMKHVVDFVESGKPLLGIRTSTHAFNYKRNKESPYFRYTFRSKEWPGGFGRQILGDTWINHHGGHGSESTRGVPAPGAESHPLLRGVKDVWGPTDVYGVRNFPKDGKPILMGQVVKGMKPTDPPVEGRKNDPMMPLVWVRELARGGRKGRVICSTIGASVDFESEGLRRTFVNACYWGLEMEDRIPQKADVGYVGGYAPLFFGFKRFRRGVRPADLALDAEVPPLGRLKLLDLVDGAALPADEPVTIKGEADPGEQVEVSFAGQDRKTEGNRFGRWSVKLEPMPADATGRELTVKGARGGFFLKNVVVGGGR